MIELVLEIRHDAEETSIRGLVGRRDGITLIGPGKGLLDERDDVDTLLLEDWYAVDLYSGRPPRELGWVVVDAVQNIRCLVYEAAIAPVGSEFGRPITTHASWIVSISHGAPSKFADGGDPNAVRDAERGEQFLSGMGRYFPLFLNAFEIMERHNMAGTVPPIHRVGIWAYADWMPGLLHAYDTYHERALTGVYAGHAQPDDGSGA